MTDKLLYAYLAGCLDSDGSFGIKRNTYSRRVVGDSVNDGFSERVLLKQVTPQVPQLLRDAFGGYLRLDKPSTQGGKPIWAYQATNKQAVAIVRAVLPYLRIKHRQAKILLELRHTKETRQYHQYAYWFLQENPNWQSFELITTTEASKMLGYGHKGSITQAIKKGTLLALPYDNIAQERPRIPKALAEIVTAHQTVSGSQSKPPQLIEWRMRLWNEIRELNKIGVNGTEIYRRTGTHKPADW